MIRMKVRAHNDIDICGRYAGAGKGGEKIGVRAPVPVRASLTFLIFAYTTVDENSEIVDTQHETPHA
jgi:hypothetical protein